ncbi:transcriptional regulator [Pseudomonas stutzeri]|nr:transcriptional regulator [Stutzerimonas stutzeri]MCQ4258845.1 transcriptional regulator [Stutzerimonas stutzeri]
MLTSHPSVDQSLISQTEVCKAIGQTRSGLQKLREKDSTFPKPIKFGATRQSASYYVVAEVNAWLRAKIEARDCA